MRSSEEFLQLALDRIISSEHKKGALSAPDEGQIEDEDQRSKRLENDHAQQRIDLQEQMFTWVKVVVAKWLKFIGLFLTFYVLINMGFVFFDKSPFVLEKEIIITLLATTTINILGLPFIIAKSLFKE